MCNLIVFRTLALGKVERNGMLQYSQSPLERSEFDSASLNGNAFFLCGVCVSSFDTGGKPLQILTGFAAAAWYLRLCELTALV